MEGKTLYFHTKTCDATDCVNNHAPRIEKLENYIVSLFDIQALNNGIIPKTVLFSGMATHMQYMDINGTIHLRSRGNETPVFSDIVNFRLLRLSRPLTSFPSLETDLGDVIDDYIEHVYKP